MTNPFTPTFGTVPVFPAGRKYIMEDMKSAFENWETNPSISCLLIGPRGSGKTALLSMIADEARKQGWIVIHCSAEEGMKENIYQKILIASSDLIMAGLPGNIYSLLNDKKITIFKKSKSILSGKIRMTVKKSP